MLTSLYNTKTSRIEFPAGQHSLICWKEDSPISTHQNVGIFFPATDHEDIGFKLRFLKHIGQNLRLLLIVKAKFAWQDLVPLLDHIDQIQVVDSMVVDSIPDELHYEGLLFSLDYSRHLVVQGDYEFSVRGNLITFLAASESAPSLPFVAGEENNA